MDTVIQYLLQLETSILALSADDREKIQKVYHTSLTRFRTKTHRERGDDNYGKPYSSEEQKKIQELSNQGFSDEYIAQELKRSVKGVVQQRQKLIVTLNPEESNKLVKKFTPLEPCANFLIPQHTN
jgi:uncharacterized protein YwgA